MVISAVPCLREGGSYLSERAGSKQRNEPSKLSGGLSFKCSCQTGLYALKLVSFSCGPSYQLCVPFLRGQWKHRSAVRNWGLRWNKRESITQYLKIKQTTKVKIPASQFTNYMSECIPACMHAKSLQSCLTFCDPVDCSPPSSSVHGILQARILEWITMPSFRGSSRPRDWTCISCIGGGGLYH